MLAIAFVLANYLMGFFRNRLTSQVAEAGLHEMEEGLAMLSLQIPKGQKASNDQS